MLKINALTIPISVEVSVSIILISLTYTLGLINLLVILYDTYTFYINVVLKECFYLFLYNNSRFQNRYKFKNLDIYSRCEKEHNKSEPVGWLIDDSYNIKYLFSSCEKEIKINASLKFKKSILTISNNYDKIAK